MCGGWVAGVGEMLQVGLGGHGPKVEVAEP